MWGPTQAKPGSQALVSSRESLFLYVLSDWEMKDEYGSAVC